MKITLGGSFRFGASGKSDRDWTLQHMQDNTRTHELARAGVFDASELRRLTPELKQKLDYATLRIPNTHRGIVVINPQNDDTLRLETHREGFRLVHFPKAQGKLTYTFNPGEQVVTVMAQKFATGDIPASRIEKPVADLSDENLMGLLDRLMTLPVANRMPLPEDGE